MTPEPSGNATLRRPAQKRSDERMPRNNTRRAMARARPAMRDAEGTAMAPFGPANPTRRDVVFRRLLGLADLTAAAGGLMILAALASPGLRPASVATLPLIVLIAKVSGRYDHDEVVLRKSTLDEAPALMTLAAAYALAWSLVTVAFSVHSDRGGVILLWATTAALLIACRATARALAQRWAPVERILIVGADAARSALGRRLARDSAARLEIVGFLPLEDERRVDVGPPGPDRRKTARSIEDIESVVTALDVHRVVVIPLSADPETMLDALAKATSVGVKVSIVPRILEIVGSAVEFDEVGGVTVLGVRRPGLSRSSRLAKRVVDITASALGLILVAPLGALVALAIKLDSPGPVFFRQRRVGRDGRSFQMIKFRSMVDGADGQQHALEPLNESEGIFKLSDDPRVTRVGRRLRGASLDELPQLINVLRGDMSLVGPRPLPAEEDRHVAGRHRGRLLLSPGMTGPWQVLGPERPPLGEMVKLDYLYGANWSLWSDAKILMRTLAHVFARRGV